MPCKREIKSPITTLEDGLRETSAVRSESKIYARL